MKMRLYIVRHAEAVAKTDAVEDADRVLTELGIEQARALASAFSRRGLELDAVVSSPYVRAHQTAMELIDTLKPTLPDVIMLDLLTPESLKPRKLSRFLAELGRENVAIVGHMPELGMFAEWLIGAREGSLPLEKAAAVCLEFDVAPLKGEGELMWLVTPDWFMSAAKAAI